MSEEGISVMRDLVEVVDAVGEEGGEAMHGEAAEEVAVVAMDEEGVAEEDTVTIVIRDIVQGMRAGTDMKVGEIDMVEEEEETTKMEAGVGSVPALRGIAAMNGNAEERARWR